MINMTETTQQLTQGKNTVVITGELATNNLEVKVSAKGVEYITGYVDIKTAENETHRVNFFEMATFNSGKENNAFKGLRTAMDTKVSIADIAEGKVAETVPSKVRVTGGQLEMNDYYHGATEQVVSTPRVSGRYIADLKLDAKGNLPQFGATFQVQGVLQKKVVKEDNNGDVKVTLQLLNPDFRGTLTPIELVAYGGAAEHFEANVDNGQALFLEGNLKNIYERHEKEVQLEGMFGEPMIETTQRTVREWVVTRGGNLTYGTGVNEVNWDDAELLRKALAERETMLAGLKGKYEERQGKKKASSDPFATPAGNDPFAEAKEEVDLGALGNMFG